VPRVSSVFRTSTSVIMTLGVITSKDRMIFNSIKFNLFCVESLQIITENYNKLQMLQISADDLLADRTGILHRPGKKPSHHWPLESGNIIIHEKRSQDVPKSTNLFPRLACSHFFRVALSSHDDANHI
jgi:hypothetical protein